MRCLWGANGGDGCIPSSQAKATGYMRMTTPAHCSTVPCRSPTTFAPSWATSHTCCSVQRPAAAADCAACPFPPAAELGAIWLGRNDPGPPHPVALQHWLTITPTSTALHQCTPPLHSTAHLACRDVNGAQKLNSQRPSLLAACAACPSPASSQISSPTKDNVHLALQD